MWISDNAPGFPARDKVCVAMGPYRVLRGESAGFELVRLNYTDARCIESESLGQYLDVWDATREAVRRCAH